MNDALNFDNMTREAIEAASLVEYPTFESLVIPAFLGALYADNCWVCPEGEIYNDDGDKAGRLSDDELRKYLMWQAATERRRQAALTISLVLSCLVRDEDDIWF